MDALVERWLKRDSDKLAHMETARTAFAGVIRDGVEAGLFLKTDEREAEAGGRLRKRTQSGSWRCLSQG